MTQKGRIKIPNLSTDRAGTLRLMSWWEHDKVEAAKVMIVGAGALGNEVIKNLALMGVGHLFIIDRDTIEAANLSRSILFREADNGRRKTDVAAESVKGINPQVKVKTFDGDVNLDLGLGVFRRMDVVVGCLDNREARLSVNRFCWKVDKPWVDGAIEELFGIARVFVPNRGACYECTLSDADWQMLNQRVPCKDLAMRNILLGKVPTTPTISSIIAGVQSQEALKLIHGMSEFVLAGQGLIFNGLTNHVHTTAYPVKEMCLSHYIYPEPLELPKHRADNTTLAEMLAVARTHLGEDAVIELDYELVVTLKCYRCNVEERVLKPQGKVFVEDAICTSCEQAMIPETLHRITGTEDFLDSSLFELGIPPLHIVKATGDAGSKYFELTGDVESVLDFQ
jgi:molybdopterin/thiamine biosynthesis adenylyltransferase